MTNKSHLALDDKPGLDLETNFGRLVRRAPTATEKERLHHIKSSLGIRDADAIWSILMALQFYDSLYSQYPKAIGAEASRIFGDVKAAAEASLNASIATARADLGQGGRVGGARCRARHCAAREHPLGGRGNGAGGDVARHGRGRRDLRRSAACRAGHRRGRAEKVSSLAARKSRKGLPMGGEGVWGNGLGGMGARIRL